MDIYYAAIESEYPEQYITVSGYSLRIIIFQLNYTLSALQRFICQTQDFLMSGAEPVISVLPGPSTKPGQGVLGCRKADTWQKIVS